MPKSQDIVVGFGLAIVSAILVFIGEKSLRHFKVKIRENLSAIISFGYIGVLVYGLIEAALILNPADIITLVYQVLIVLLLLGGAGLLFWVTKKIDARFATQKR